MTAKGGEIAFEHLQDLGRLLHKIAVRGAATEALQPECAAPRAQVEHPRIGKDGVHDAHPRLAHPIPCWANDVACRRLDAASLPTSGNDAHGLLRRMTNVGHTQLQPRHATVFIALEPEREIEGT